MTNYEYYITMKNIAEDKGREHPENRKLFSEAAEGFERKAKSIIYPEPVSEAQKKLLALHGIIV